MESSNKISAATKLLALANDIDQNNNETIRDELVKFINELINKDFSSLVQLLYRIDIDENNLKQILKQHDGADSASLIAEMIIKRQLQKIATRKKTSGDNKLSPEDRW